MNPQNFVLARIFPVNPQNLALFVATKPQNLALFVAMNPQNLETFFLRIKKIYDGFYDICHGSCTHKSKGIICYFSCLIGYA